MVAAAGGTPSSQIAVAVPAHWTGATLRSLRLAMRAKPRLAPNGVPARLVSDAVAALTALNANPGLPGRGVVALLDFGGGGTSITLADAASTFEPVETSRLTESLVSKSTRRCSPTYSMASPMPAGSTRRGPLRSGR